MRKEGCQVLGRTDHILVHRILWWTAKIPVSDISIFSLWYTAVPYTIWLMASHCHIKGIYDYFLWLIFYHFSESFDRIRHIAHIAILILLTRYGFSTTNAVLNNCTLCYLVIHLGLIFPRECLEHISTFFGNPLRSWTKRLFITAIIWAQLLIYGNH